MYRAQIFLQYKDQYISMGVPWFIAAGCIRAPREQVFWKYCLWQFGFSITKPGQMHRLWRLGSGPGAGLGLLQSLYTVYNVFRNNSQYCILLWCWTSTFNPYILAGCKTKEHININLHAKFIFNYLKKIKKLYFYCNYYNDTIFFWYNWENSRRERRFQP